MEFGELVEPDTRAFWEDYDQPAGEATPAPSWKWMDDEYEHDGDIAAFDTLFIIEGKQIFDFVNRTTLKGALPTCQIDGQKTAIYSFPENGYAICLSEGNDVNTTGQITELLKPWLEKVKHTVAISIQPAYTYHTTKDFDKRCFVRSLGAYSDVTEKIVDIEPLEDCNIIPGVSAGVSSWRHINKKSFRCYVVYIDCPTIDSIVGAPILKLFSGLGIKCDTKYEHRYVNNSNLYI